MTKTDTQPSAADPSSNTGSINVLTLVMVTSALFLTLRNLPSLADAGLKMLFFNSIAAFAFLIPVALVSAELATGWPKNGVYHWVRAAYGPRFGFLASWLQWAQSLFGMTSILAYMAATFAYVFQPDLADDQLFVVGVVIIVYWLATLANMRGMRLSGMISTVCVSLGVLFPILVLVVLGILYLVSGGHNHLAWSDDLSSWMPKPNDKIMLLMFLNIIFGYVGVEVSASHARDVRNVHRTYPIAIFSAAFIGFTLTLAGGFVVAVVLPAKDIDVVSGVVRAFDVFGDYFKLAWILPAAALLVALGAAGQVSTWIIGPVKGLFAVALAGDLPSVFQRTNKAGVPRNLLYTQAGIFSLIAITILFFPDLDSAFMILTTIAVLLYSMMYCIMFSAAIFLRYKEPHVKRPYRIPGGNIGIWLVSGVGLITLLACFFIAFIPPPELRFMSSWTFVAMLLGLTLVVLIIPLLIFWLRRRRRYFGK